MSAEINIVFGANLRKFREARGMTQEQFAELCGISRAYYGRIERGEHSATIEMCDNIASALGVHISDLFVNLPY
ncbi:helix-turn-helix transcriptional regulator [Paratractidigestivibacter sp.]|uniref:helix-turn-helix domain-containing protein n=1 Tax=Paratractidigestivibacter sp. TaxID=2847316 RepID=UPI002ACB0C36|nr:helix-turn-helix transcriptional regulator [Paratractidigestivibacter sp.]